MNKVINLNKLAVRQYYCALTLGGGEGGEQIALSIVSNAPQSYVILVLIKLVTRALMFTYFGFSYTDFDWT